MELESFGSLYLVDSCELLTHPVRSVILLALVLQQPYFYRFC